MHKTQQSKLRCRWLSSRCGFEGDDVLLCCAAQNAYSFKARAQQEKAHNPVEVRAVTAAEVRSTQPRRERLSVSFGPDQDGAKLVADFLDQAE